MPCQRDSLLMVGLGMVVAAAPAFGKTTGERKGNAPNIILIMADDLGQEALGCYGGTTHETPLLDKLAAQGMRFTHCYSQPICTPSRVKIMTGRSNARNYRHFGDMDPKEITFGHIMKRAGYKTCIAGKWQLCGGTGHRGSFPDSAGFEQSCMWAYYHDLPGDAAEKYTFFGKRPKRTSRYWNPGIVRNGQYVPTTTDDYGPDIFCEFILDFIERSRDEPFFVYYPMVLTHIPFLATPLSKDQSERAKTKSSTRFFGDMVRYTGRNVDRIIRKLGDLGIAEDTLVLFTTDNGNHRSLVTHASNRVVVGGKGLPIDAGVHGPLIAYWKGTIEPGSMCHDLVDFSDFLPTLADLAGAPLPTDRVLDGRSFLPQLKNKPGNPRQAVVVHYDKDPDRAKPHFRRVRFAYDGKYKLYLDNRMYDVPEDWNEEHPISRDRMTNAEKAARRKLRKALDAMPAWSPDNSAFEGDSDPELDAYRRKSRALNKTNKAGT